MTPREAYLIELAHRDVVDKANRNKKKTDPEVTFNRDPETEGVLATDPDYAHRYAFHALKGRFELGEAVIQTNALCWAWYQADVLKTKLLEG